MVPRPLLVITTLVASLSHCDGSTPNMAMPLNTNAATDSLQVQLNSLSHLSQLSNHTASTMDYPEVPELASTDLPVNRLAAKGDVDRLEEVLEEEPVWVMARDSHGWTPLHEAARANHMEVVDLLLEYGAELNARCNAGGTPLYFADIYYGQDSEMSRHLESLGGIRLESKRRLRGQSTTSNIRDPRAAQRLAAQGYLEELKELVDQEGMDVLDRQDVLGWTPLHEAARKGHLHIVRYLVEKGVDVNTRCRDGQTPLFFCHFKAGKKHRTCKYLEANGGVV